MARLLTTRAACTARITNPPSMTAPTAIAADATELAAMPPHYRRNFAAGLIHGIFFQASAAFSSNSSERKENGTVWDKKFLAWVLPMMAA